MNVFGRTIVVSTAATRHSPSASIFDSPYDADADERIVLLDRMLLRHAVDRGRRDEDDTPDARVVRGAQHVLGSADVDRANRFARGLDRQRRRRVHDHVGARHELADAVAVANVAAQLLDGALELGVVQRDDVEGSHVMPVGEQPSSEVQAEKARAAGDRPEHLPGNATRRRRRGRRRNRRLRVHEHRGGEQHGHADHALAEQAAAQARQHAPSLATRQCGHGDELVHAAPRERERRRARS